MLKEKYTLLLIDDERINLVILQALLQKEGYSVYTALNGREGIALAHQLRPNLILLDVMMPGEDGFEVCRKLKQDPVTASIPVIFITGLTDTENRIKGLTIGGLDYISKPFEKKEVFMRVRNILLLNYSFQRIIDEQTERLCRLRDAQRAILVDPEEVPGGKFSVYFQPLLDAGGDFYDVFEVANNVCDYFIADISGHDLAASFTTSALKALVRYNSSQILTVEESMTIINRVLQSVLSEDQHITAIYVRLNRNTMKMHVVNAANPPVLFIPSRGESCWINGNSDPLGAFAGGVFAAREIDVARDDRFFLFTDGIVETPLSNHNRERGLELLYRECTTGSSGSYLPAGLHEIVQKLFPGGKQADDDVLLLSAQV
ncbi:MAG: SpoIIE family protein phosphatase [Desulfobulbaceae bacterium]|nr:SpoIIE family protein phosphatase [Desulfobulbaceae bacterium]